MERKNRRGRERRCVRREGDRGGEQARDQGGHQVAVDLEMDKQAVVFEG